MLKFLNNIVLLIIKYDMCLNIEYNEAVILQNEFHKFQLVFLRSRQKKYNFTNVKIYGNLIVFKIDEKNCTSCDVVCVWLYYNIECTAGFKK